MATAKEEVESLLNKLADDCSLEDIQYHLYVIEKVRHGLAAADNHGALTQEEAESQLTALYAGFADEDRYLAEESIEDYGNGLLAEDVVRRGSDDNR